MSLLHSFGSAGIYTCCPSPTTSVLGLGPDLPWVDEPSPGNLGLSTAWFLAMLSLLIPAFSLEYRPPCLSIRLQPIFIAPLPRAVMIPNLGVMLCFWKFTHLHFVSVRIVLLACFPNSGIITAHPSLRCHVLAPDIFGAQPLDQ